MAFRPLHDRVLVEPLDAEEKSAGGIIIPDTAQEKPMEGAGSAGNSNFDTSPLGARRPATASDRRKTFLAWTLAAADEPPAK